MAWGDLMCLQHALSGSKALGCAMRRGPPSVADQARRPRARRSGGLRLWWLMGALAPNFAFGAAGAESPPAAAIPVQEPLRGPNLESGWHAMPRPRAAKDQKALAQALAGRGLTVFEKNDTYWVYAPATIERPPSALWGDPNGHPQAPPDSGPWHTLSVSTPTLYEKEPDVLAFAFDAREHRYRTLETGEMLHTNQVYWIFDANKASTPPKKWAPKAVLAGGFPPPSALSRKDVKARLPQTALGQNDGSPVAHLAYVGRRTPSAPDQIFYRRNPRAAQAQSFEPSRVIATLAPGWRVTDLALSARANKLSLGWIQNLEDDTVGVQPASQVVVLESLNGGEEFGPQHIVRQNSHWKRHVSLAYDQGGEHHLIWGEANKVYYTRNLHETLSNVFDVQKPKPTPRTVKYLAYYPPDGQQGCRCPRCWCEESYSPGQEPHSNPSKSGAHGRSELRTEVAYMTEPSLHVGPSHIHIIAHQMRMWDNRAVPNPVWDTLFESPRYDAEVQAGTIPTRMVLGWQKVWKHAYQPGDESLWDTLGARFQYRYAGRWHTQEEIKLAQRPLYASRPFLPPSRTPAPEHAPHFAAYAAQAPAHPWRISRVAIANSGPVPGRPLRPEVAIAPDGMLVAVFEEHAANEASPAASHTIRTSTSEDGGLTWSNASAIANGSFPALALTQDGQATVAYQATAQEGQKHVIQLTRGPAIGAKAPAITLGPASPNKETGVHAGRLPASGISLTIQGHQVMIAWVQSAPAGPPAQDRIALSLTMPASRARPTPSIPAPHSPPSRSIPRPAGSTGSGPETILVSNPPTPAPEGPAMAPSAPEVRSHDFLGRAPEDPTHSAMGHTEASSQIHLASVTSVDGPVALTTALATPPPVPSDKFHPRMFVSEVRENYEKARLLRDTLLRHVVDETGAEYYYQVEYQADHEVAYEAERGTGLTEDARTLAGFERVWAYTQGIALAQRATDPDEAKQAQGMARYLCRHAVRAPGSSKILGWPFSWNTHLDNWKDMRLVTGATAWAIHGLGVFLSSPAYTSYQGEDKKALRSCYLDALEGLKDHRHPIIAEGASSASLMSAGWTTAGLRWHRDPQRIRLAGGTPIKAEASETWAYYSVLDAIGYDAFAPTSVMACRGPGCGSTGSAPPLEESFGGQGAGPWALRPLEDEAEYQALRTRIQSRHIVTEHNLDVLSVLNHALEHHEALELPDVAGLRAWRDALLEGIFFALWDTHGAKENLRRRLAELEAQNETEDFEPPGTRTPDDREARIAVALENGSVGRFVTGGVLLGDAPTGFRLKQNPHTAIDNCSWLVLAVLAPNPGTTRGAVPDLHVERLAQCLAYTVVQYVKNLGYGQRTCTGSPCLAQKTHRGTHYFQNTFKDPYIEPSSLQESSYHLEATLGLTLGLLRFGQAHPEHPSADWLLTEAQRLWAGTQGFVTHHGFPYSSQRIHNLSTLLESSTAAIWFIDGYAAFRPGQKAATDLGSATSLDDFSALEDIELEPERETEVRRQLAARGLDAFSTFLASDLSHPRFDAALGALVEVHMVWGLLFDDGMTAMSLKDWIHAVEHDLVQDLCNPQRLLHQASTTFEDRLGMNCVQAGAKARARFRARGSMGHGVWASTVEPNITFERVKRLAGEWVPLWRDASSVSPPTQDVPVESLILALKGLGGFLSTEPPSGVPHAVLLGFAQKLFVHRGKLAHRFGTQALKHVDDVFVIPPELALAGTAALGAAAYFGTAQVDTGLETIFLGTHPPGPELWEETGVIVAEEAVAQPLGTHLLPETTLRATGVIYPRTPDVDDPLKNIARSFEEPLIYYIQVERLGVSLPGSTALEILTPHKNALWPVYHLRSEASRESLLSDFIKNHPLWQKLAPLAESLPESARIGWLHLVALVVRGEYSLQAAEDQARTGRSAKASPPPDSALPQKHPPFFTQRKTPHSLSDVRATLAAQSVDVTNPDALKQYYGFENEMRIGAEALTDAELVLLKHDAFEGRDLVLVHNTFKGYAVFPALERVTQEGSAPVPHTKWTDVEQWSGNTRVLTSTEGTDPQTVRLVVEEVFKHVVQTTLRSLVPDGSVKIYGHDLVAFVSKHPWSVSPMDAYIDSVGEARSHFETRPDKVSFLFSGSGLYAARFPLTDDELYRAKQGLFASHSTLVQFHIRREKHPQGDLYLAFTLGSKHWQHPQLKNAAPGTVTLVAITGLLYLKSGLEKLETKLKSLALQPPYYRMVETDHVRYVDPTTKHWSVGETTLSSTPLAQFREGETTRAQAPLSPLQTFMKDAHYLKSIPDAILKKAQGAVPNLVYVPTAASAISIDFLDPLSADHNGLVMASTDANFDGGTDPVLSSLTLMSGHGSVYTVEPPDSAIHVGHLYQSVGLEAPPAWKNLVVFGPTMHASRIVGAHTVNVFGKAVPDTLRNNVLHPLGALLPQAPSPNGHARGPIADQFSDGVRSSTQPLTDQALLDTKSEVFGQRFSVIQLFLRGKTIPTGGLYLTTRLGSPFLNLKLLKETDEVLLVGMTGNDGPKVERKNVMRVFRDLRELGVTVPYVRVIKPDHIRYYDTRLNEDETFVIGEETLHTHPHHAYLEGIERFFPDQSTPWSTILTDTTVYQGLPFEAHKAGIEGAPEFVYWIDPLGLFQDTFPSLIQPSDQPTLLTTDLAPTQDAHPQWADALKSGPVPVFKIRAPEGAIHVGRAYQGVGLKAPPLWNKAVLVQQPIPSANIAEAFKVDAQGRVIPGTERQNPDYEPPLKLKNMPTGATYVDNHPITDVQLFALTDYLNKIQKGTLEERDLGSWRSIDVDRARTTAAKVLFREDHRPPLTPNGLFRTIMRPTHFSGSGERRAHVYADTYQSLLQDHYLTIGQQEGTRQDREDASVIDVTWIYIIENDGRALNMVNARNDAITGEHIFPEYVSPAQIIGAQEYRWDPKTKSVVQGPYFTNPNYKSRTSRRQP